MDMYGSLSLLSSAPLPAKEYNGFDQLILVYLNSRYSWRKLEYQHVGDRVRNTISREGKGNEGFLLLNDTNHEVFYCNLSNSAWLTTCHCPRYRTTPYT